MVVLVGLLPASPRGIFSMNKADWRQGTIEENVKADQIIPVVVLSEKEVESGPEELWRILQFLVDNDDVCSDDFTGIIVEKPATNSHASNHLGTHSATQAIFGPSPENNPSIFHLQSGPRSHQEAEDRLPSGPYFLNGQNLHQAWRLYSDELEAFNFGLLPEDAFNLTR